MKWFDYVFFPWTVSKWTWEKVRPQKPQEPGRAPQTSCYGRALPLVYGRTRITGNVIYFADLPDNQIATAGQTAVMLALCEGPIDHIARVWKDRDYKAAPSDWGLTTGTGARPTQTAWTELPSEAALGYPGIAWVAIETFSSYASTIGQMSFEVYGLLQGTGGSDGDANPADILATGSPDYSLLTSTTVGAGFPFQVVTDTGRDGSANSSFRRYVTAEGFWLSPALTDQRPAREHLDDILQSCNATCLWTGGKLEIVPLGDSAVTGNSVTYTPDLTIQYAIEPGDYATTEDPITIELPPESDTYNVAPVELLDRAPEAATDDPAYAYNTAIVEDPDPVDVALRGERRAPAVSLHHICDRDVALKISRIRAQSMVRSRARYTLKLPWRYCRLEPLDFITVTDPLLGLSAQPVRIDRITEDPETRSLEVEATEWPFGVGSAAAHTTQSSDGPSSALNPVDPNVWLLQGQVGELWPNGTSEINPGPTDDETGPAFANRYEAGTGAWAGSWVRKIVGGASDNEFLYGPMVPAVPGHVFTIEARARRESGSGYVTIGFQAFDSAGEEVAGSVPTLGTSSTWEHTTASYTVPSVGASIRPYLRVSPETEGWFDAISAYRSSTTPPTLTASALPATVSGSCFRAGAGTCAATTGAALASVTGGIPTYSYAWEYVSGTSATVNSPTSSSTTFTRTAAAAADPGSVVSGVYRCVVTDHDGNTAATSNVTVTTTHTILS